MQWGRRERLYRLRRSRSGECPSLCDSGRRLLGNRRTRWQESARIRAAPSNAKLPVMRPDAGIDIGATEIFVAVPPARAAENVRSFPTFTQDSMRWPTGSSNVELRRWPWNPLVCTGSPLFQILEEREFEVCLVNARHVKNVPGRRTDVSDCQWLQSLHSVGLLRASYRPGPGSLRRALSAAASGEPGANGRHARTPYTEVIAKSRGRSAITERSICSLCDSHLTAYRS
jgi:hypothetical protein